MAVQLKYPDLSVFFVGPANSVNNIFDKTGAGVLHWSLSSMVDGSGYWVYATSNKVVLSFNGWVIQPASAPPGYSLVKGWNLVGFKPEPTVQSESVSQYLSTLNGDYDPNNVWVYTNSGWVRAEPNYMLQPGQAMWILMTAPAILRP